MESELLQFAVDMAFGGAFGVCVHFIIREFRKAQDERQIPLKHFTKDDYYLAFRFAPERRAEIINRGSMSNKEFRELQLLNLERIDDALRGMEKEVEDDS